MAAAVIMPDGSRWSGASGIAGADPRRAATADTPFVLGSITKTYVTAVIMQLVAEGRMTLDDPLANWLPDYPRAKRITLRMLLTHSSGVFNYFEHSSYTRLVYNDPGHVWSPDEILSTFRHAPDFPPGTDYHYSNTGFVLLGRVIELETGHSLWHEFQKRLFEPLGLDNTFFQDDQHPVPAGVSAADAFRQGSNGLYQYGDDSGYMPTASVATVAWAAGAMCASAPDLATWINAVYSGKIVRADLLAQMEDWIPSPYPRSDYGLGTRTTVIDGFRAFGHTGSLLGYRAFAWYFPDLDLTLVAVNNRGLVNPDAEAAAMFRVAAPAAAAYLGVSYPAP
jgi:D-alanyl-D-alanine carboxypeptidase